MENNLLRVDKLVKGFGGRTVVRGISFSMEKGEIMGLLGRNGAGKTTTFRMIVGMIRPDEGSVYFRKGDITYLPMYKRARLGMGYLSQEPSIFRGLKVKDNLLAILETMPLSRAERLRRCAELIEELGLAKLKNQKALTLSGGERRRLEIARALVLNPSLILLDEPFAGIDPIAVQDIQGLVRGLKDKGIAILLTDHNVRETLAITDRSTIVDEGKVIAQGSPKEIVEDEIVRKTYLGEEFQMPEIEGQGSKEEKK
jgi:lipopolysaccharide export system ATP-binding protein